MRSAYVEVVTHSQRPLMYGQPTQSTWVGSGTLPSGGPLLKGQSVTDLLQTLSRALDTVAASDDIQSLLKVLCLPHSKRLVTSPSIEQFYSSLNREPVSDLPHRSLRDRLRQNAPVHQPTAAATNVSSTAADLILTPPPNTSSQNEHTDSTHQDDQYADSESSSSERDTARALLLAAVEFLSVSVKTPTTLHHTAVLRSWEEGRLERWKQWQHRHLELLQLQELKRRRRRQFLSQLQDHPWLQEPTASAQAPATSANEDQTRLKLRRQLFTKLRTTRDPQHVAETSTPPPSKSPTPSQSTETRRTAITTLQRRPSQKDSPKPSSSPEPPTSLHAGSLPKAPELTFWDRWEARDALQSARMHVLTILDGGLYRANRQIREASSSIDTARLESARSRLEAKRSRLFECVGLQEIEQSVVP
ncbi:hypothetical protein BJ742DRAFT_44486 [Cladochytrium replicatum]|nr:hypothetical protein BJ742DRAFT_44486 [Cladochytrium replicatum]